MLRRWNSQLRPRPAGTRVRCTAETCYTSCSVKVLLAHRCKHACSDPQPTHAPISQNQHEEDILDRPTSSIPQRAGTPRVYYNAQANVRERCSGSSGRLPASSRILSLHTLPSRQLVTSEISWIDYPSRENQAQAILFVSYRHKEHLKRCAARRTNNLHNPICRPKSTPRSCAPECFTRTESAAESQVISPGPVSKRVDLVWPPAESRLRQ